MRSKNKKGPQAPAAPTGMQYGQRQDLMGAQKQMPVASPETPTLPPSAPTPAPGPQSMGGIEQVMADAQSHPFEPMNLAGPTSRPNEPITKGMLHHSQLPPATPAGAPLDNPLDILKAAYAVTRDPDLLDYIRYHDNGGA